MARLNYFNGGDHYSQWHRSKCEGVAYIDIDSVPCCIHKGCWQPLAIIETVFNVGTYKKKYTTIVEHIAKSLNIPCYLLYYKPIPSSDSLEFVYAQKYPFKTDLNPILEGEWYQLLLNLQIEHNKHCKYAKI